MKSEITNLKSVARQGLVECVQHELLHPYPILTEKKGELVAQFKYTIAVRKEKEMPLMLAGSIIDVSRYQSDFKIVDEKLLKLLAEPLDQYLPNNKKTVKKDKKKKDNKEKKKKRKEAKLKKKEELRKKQEEGGNK